MVLVHQLAAKDSRQEGGLVLNRSALRIAKENPQNPRVATHSYVWKVGVGQFWIVSLIFTTIFTCIRATVIFFSSPVEDAFGGSVKMV